MTNPKKRLSIYTSNCHHDLIFRPTPEHFQQLEGEYGQSISDEARTELVEIANGYMTLRDAEMNSLAWADVTPLFKELQASVNGFQAFAFGHIPGREASTDAWKYLARVVDQHLPWHPATEAQPDAIRVGGKDGPALGWRILQEVSTSLDQLFKRMEADLEAQGADPFKGFVKGVAFSDWLLKMREWAKKCGYKLGPFTSDDAPSKFAKFLFRLIKLIGSQLPNGQQETAPSAAALAQQLKKAKGKAKRQHRGECTV